MTDRVKKAAGVSGRTLGQGMHLWSSRAERKSVVSGSSVRFEDGVWVWERIGSEENMALQTLLTSLQCVLRTAGSHEKLLA